MLRFNDLGYMGSISRGTLSFQTLDEDVIVQTYNDPKGNIDSMANYVKLPMKQMEAEDLLLIREDFLKIKKALQN